MVLILFLQKEKLYLYGIFTVTHNCLNLFILLYRLHVKQY